MGAASLGADDGEAQVMLINSVKDVALALNNLINVTKTASGKSIDDPEMQKLKYSDSLALYPGECPKMECGLCQSQSGWTWFGRQ